ncbi:MAG TPA: hypothetical protein DCM02_04755, partial [Flavobacterium sp.]|nr:hypothetical protein [Flavobacterium sp.]
LIGLRRKPIKIVTKKQGIKKNPPSLLKPKRILFIFVLYQLKQVELYLDIPVILTPSSGDIDPLWF